MKKFRLLFLAIMVSGCGASVATDPHAALDIEAQNVRGWRVEDGHIGESLDVPAPGKVTVLDFWSTSCEPCIAAMPELERIWKAVDRERVSIIGVSIDTDDALTRETVATKFPCEVTFPVVYDGKAARLQGIYRVAGAVPSTFVLDRAGRVRFYFDGSPGDLERLERAIEILAGE